MKKNLLLLAMAILFGSCANGYLPTAENLASPKGSSNTDKQRLNQGRSLVVGNCASCHRMIYPQELSLKNWKRILPNMARRAGFDLSEQEKVELYISAVKKTDSPKEK